MGSDESATPATRSEDGDTPALSLVIPTLNEETGIVECIERAQAAFDELGVTGEIIVSDNSTDATPERARQLGARVVTPDREGYGYAYRYAFDYARGDIIIIGDGDTTYDFRQIPRLVRELEAGADLVLGSRFDGDLRPGAMPLLHKYVGNPVLTRFLNLFYRMDVSDAHSGFRGFTREALEQMDLSTTGMEFASEMLIRTKTAGLDVREVPITYHPREGDATIESLEDGWRHVRFLVVHAPGEVFVVPGLAALLLGALLVAISFLDTPPVGFLSVNTVTAGSLLTLLGSHTTALGVFSSLARDPIRNPRQFVTTDLVDHLTVERGLVAGLSLSLLGAAAAGYELWVWIASGFAVVPAPEVGIVTMTALALGIQTTFHMLFISLLTEITPFE